MIAIAKSSRDAGKDGRLACKVAMKMGLRTDWCEGFLIDRLYQGAAAIVLSWRMSFCKDANGICDKKEATYSHQRAHDDTTAEAPWQKRVTTWRRCMVHP
jgi:hypothetical protein